MAFFKNFSGGKENFGDDDDHMNGVARTSIMEKFGLVSEAYSGVDSHL